jgi:elongation factor 1-gamma
MPLRGNNPRFPYNKAAVEAAKAKTLEELAFLDNSLQTKTFLVGNRITIADLFVASVVASASEFVFDAEVRKNHVNVFRHLNTIVNQEQYKAASPAPTFVEKAITYTPPKKEPKPAAAAPAPKAAPAPAAAADEEEAPAAPKPKHPCEALGQPKSFPFDEWKRQYSNNDTPVAMKWLEEHYDETASQEYSFWRADYKYNDELTQGEKTLPKKRVSRNLLPLISLPLRVSFPR